MHAPEPTNEELAAALDAVASNGDALSGEQLLAISKAAARLRGAEDPTEIVRQAVIDARIRTRAVFSKALADLPEIAPPEVAALLASVHMRDEFWNEGRRLQIKHGLDAVAPRVEQECGAGAWSLMRNGVLAARNPQPPGGSIMTETDKPVERKEGYYWVRLRDDDQWRAMQWVGYAFWRCGESRIVPLQWIAEIGPRVYPPGEGMDARLSEAEALMRKAHAVMRECGWQLAVGSEPISDGILEAACTEIEADFAGFLAGTTQDPTP